MENEKSTISSGMANRMAEPPTLGEFNGHEIYPMPMFAKIFTGDVSGVADWYEQALGFSSMFRMPSPNGKPALIHLRRNKYQDILLVASDSPSAPGTLSLNFGVDGSVDEIAERARAVPALRLSAVSGPVDTPWNSRDLNVTDPEGNRLVFTGRPANPNPEQLGRWKAVFDEARKSGT